MMGGGDIIAVAFFVLAILYLVVGECLGWFRDP